MSISEEQIQQITGWNQTVTNFPRTQTVHGLFTAQAAATPDAIALEFDNQLLSYQELNQRANCLAHYLVERGVGPEVRVGVMMERGADMVIALLGILKAGGAYVPLDLDYPPSRINFMLQDASAPVLLSLSNLSVQLPDFAGERVCLDRDWAQIEKESVKNPETACTAGNLAYVIYTSGSTGTPKGVEIQHRAINRLVCNTDYYQVGSTDRIIHSSSVSFDAATFELWGALLNGARLVGIDKNSFLNTQSLAAFLQAKAITAMFVTTAVFNQIARELPGAFSGLKCLMFGGEAVDCAAVRRVLAHHPPERLLHVYGPTESTTFASWYPVAKVADDATTVPIGWPLANTTLQVLDQHMKPVAIGEPGELYIGGEGLARGYLNQPQLTAEKFIANPFADDPASRLYRTGDKVRYREDGAIEFIGRFDDQVKLRGFRIELGEVEAALRSHSDVSDAVVSLMPGRSGDQQLVAHVVTTNNGSGCEISELREYLQQKLPPHMLPAFFVALDALPLTPNGKVDRQSLPQPDSGRSQLSSDYEAPRTPFENTLATIWQQVLKVEDVGINDNFFELGGDSITGAVLTNALQDEFGVKLYVVALFDAPTIAEQIVYLKEYFPEAVAAKIECGHDPGAEKSSAEINDQPEAGPVSLRDVDDFHQLAARWHRGNNNIAQWQRCEIPRMAFVLTTPRSGSSLFRIMLAGHPRLFVPPELELLPYDSLQQRRKRLTDGIGFMREGLVRAVMELKSCDADEAQQIISRDETRDYSVQAFYRRLQEWAGDRMLVDKSATYSMSPGALLRAEQSCQDCLYIHLIRHPLGTIRSFEQARLDRVLKFQRQHPYTVRQCAELLWIVSHRNILEFLSKIPQQRQLGIRFEDLLQNPQSALERSCDFLKIDFDPAMLEPYRQQKHKMTDGVNAQSVGMTDARFHQHAGIDAEVADAWKHGFDKDFLSEEAWRLADLFDYASLCNDSDIATENNRPAVLQPGANEVDQLSDTEVDRRLQAMLAARRTS